MGSATQTRVEQPDAVAYEPLASLGKLIAFDVLLSQIANEHVDVCIIKLLDWLRRVFITGFKLSSDCRECCFKVFRMTSW